MVRSGATFDDACAEYLRYIAEDRNRKASTVEDYSSIINTHLRVRRAAHRGHHRGGGRVVSGEPGQAGSPRAADHPSDPQQGSECLHGVFTRARKVWGLPTNPAAELERHPGRKSGDIEAFSPEEVHALLILDPPMRWVGGREAARRGGDGLWGRW